MLSKQEMEIHISKNATEDMFEVYITDTKYLKQLKKLGIQPYKSEADETGNIIVGFYRIPKEQIKIVKKRQPKNISEEQRKILAERMKNVRNSK